jgi:hypothetical protein
MLYRNGRKKNVANGRHGDRFFSYIREVDSIQHTLQRLFIRADFLSSSQAHFLCARSSEQEL